MAILNPGPEDHHIHSINFSDGFNSIDEIVQYAGRLGLKRIAITDHSQASLNYYGIPKKTFRQIVHRWRNVHNDVAVAFGVEGDILNADGDVCVDIDGFESEFVILSVHPNIYTDVKRITEAYVNAIQRHHKNIHLIGHPCLKQFSENLDISRVVEAANEFNIPLEFDCSNFVREVTDLDKLHFVLREAKLVMVNSDAHTLYCMNNRQVGLKYLREQGFLE